MATSLTSAARKEIEKPWGNRVWLIEIDDAAAPDVDTHYRTTYTGEIEISRATYKPSDMRVQGVELFRAGRVQTPTIEFGPDSDVLRWINRSDGLYGEDVRIVGFSPNLSDFSDKITDQTFQVESHSFNVAKGKLELGSLWREMADSLGEPMQRAGDFEEAPGEREESRNQKRKANPKKQSNIGGPSDVEGEL